MADGDSVSLELDALHEVTQRLMLAETEQEICNVAVTAVPKLFDVKLGGFWLYDSESAELQLTAETEKAKELLGDDVVYRPGNSISWNAFEDGELRTYSVDDPNQSRYNSESRIGAELILPVGEYGVMNIGTFKNEPFDREDTQIAQILATNIEAALKKTEREHALRLKNNRLEEFVGIVSHDLRNPLTVANGNLELVRAERHDDRLDTAANAISRMSTLIDDLLTLAEQGYVVENRTSLDLLTLAERAWSNVHTPEATLQTEGTTSIFGDESRLLQVLENLFRNSIDHAGPEVKIRVGPLETLYTSTRVSQEERRDGFYVADDGPGIPDSEQSSVFEAGHSSSGTGLGLAIVQRIVEAHGWSIDIKQRVNTGARFEITDGTKSVTPFESP